jgi:two-component sensor histidine kinase
MMGPSAVESPVAVLVVEDDAIAGDMVRLALERAGVRVWLVNRVADAVTLLRRRSFSAVVLDYRLPDGDPWRVAQVAQERVPSVPIILVTGAGNEQIAAEALHRGVDGYVKKSGSLCEDLPGIVDRVIRSARADNHLRRLQVELAASLQEKETLLKEIHHRVKNNLQLICSLLNLQAQSSDDMRLSAAFEDSSNRVRSMALVHEHLYRSPDLHRIQFADYVRALLEAMVHAHGTGERIDYVVDIGSVAIPVDVAMPCALIISEIVTNAFKHAFPKDRSGHVVISMAQLPDNRLELVVSDDGIGAAPDFCLERSESLGLSLVKMLVEQLSGRLQWRNAAGLEFRITFDGAGALSQRTVHAES